MDKSLEESFERFDRDKGLWESFEKDDPRFFFPRKNYKYVSRIVANEGNTPESIDRALAYFDRHDVWLLRAEAYQHLAEQLDPKDQESIAHTVYEFVSDALPGLTLQPELHGGDDNFGSKRLDQAVARLTMAAHASRSDELISRHREFMTEIFPAMVADMPSERMDTALFIAYWQDDFEAPLNPEYYCAQNRIKEGRLSEVEARRQYVGCMACGLALMQFGDSWDVVLEARTQSCLVEGAE